MYYKTGWSLVMSTFANLFFKKNSRSSRRSQAACWNGAKDAHVQPRCPRVPINQGRTAWSYLATTCMDRRTERAELAEAEAIFKGIDQNGDGFLTALELNTRLADFGLTDEQISILFYTLDVNQDGRIDMGEWVTGYQQFRRLLTAGSPRPAPVRDVAPLAEVRDDRVGGPVRELVLSGEFQWQGATQPSPWMLQAMVDFAGNVYGANRRQRGWEMHYRGKRVSETRLEVVAHFDCGAKFFYAIDCFGESMFAGTCTVQAAARPGPDVPPQYAELVVGAVGEVQGTFAENVVRAFSICIGQEIDGSNSEGWYMWDDDEEPHQGFEVRLTVDRTGNVYGSNRNRTRGAEVKMYRGKSIQPTNEVHHAHSS
eukprot:SAG31_NODE_562_length_14085_cov_164.582869_12_plen_369_part_00